MNEDKVFRALADPTRRRILRLMKGREMSTTEILARFSLDARTIQHHCRVLKESGLANSRLEGCKIYYSLSKETAEALAELLAELLAKGE